jgi:hypothetical protein
MANKREKSWNDLTDLPGKGAGPRFESSGRGNDLPTPNGCELSGAATLSPLDYRALGAAAPASGEAADNALGVVIRTGNEPCSLDCVGALDGPNSTVHLLIASRLPNPVAHASPLHYGFNNISETGPAGRPICPVRFHAVVGPRLRATCASVRGSSG